MRKWLAFLLPLALFIAAVVALAPRTTPATDGPTHVVAVFFDGVNNGDYRATCQNWVAGRQAVTKCEQALTVNIGQGVFMGQWGGYSVVPHSAVVWSQPYRGRTVELATVRMKYHQRTQTVHLRKVHGRWLVWYVR